MLSARAIYHEICDNDDTYALFLSVAAAGESQGGWENERIAHLTSDPELSGKIARHGKDEEKHGRVFHALLRKRGLDPIEVPPEAHYTRLLEQAGIGLSHPRLKQERLLSDEEIIVYLVHSRVTEQRAAEEVAMQCRVFGDDPELGNAIRIIAADEVNHLAYCHEELLRFCQRGHEPLIRRLLRRYAQAEVRTYRDVSQAVMGEMGRKLRWSAPKRALLGFGIRAIYAFERSLGWRRLTRLRMPTRRNAMGSKTAAAAA